MGLGVDESGCHYLVLLLLLLVVVVLLVVVSVVFHLDVNRGGLRRRLGHHWLGWDVTKGRGLHGHRLSSVNTCGWVRVGVVLLLLITLGWHLRLTLHGWLLVGVVLGRNLLLLLRQRLIVVLSWILLSLIVIHL